MALIQKTDPKGLDIKIDGFQSYLFRVLGFADWQSYPRIHPVPSDPDSQYKGLIPAHFLSGSNVDYDEVYLNDEFNLSTFFYTDSDSTFESWKGKTIVSLIVQARLSDLYPSVDHIADEELNAAIIEASNNYFGFETFTLIGQKNKVQEVYEEFITDQIRLTNMQPYYVVRFDYEVNYDGRC